MCTCWLPRWYQRIQVMGLKEKKFLINRDVIFEDDVFSFRSQPNLSMMTTTKSHSTLKTKLLKAVFTSLKQKPMNTMIQK